MCLFGLFCCKFFDNDDENIISTTPPLSLNNSKKL